MGRLWAVWYSSPLKSLYVCSRIANLEKVVKSVNSTKFYDFLYILVMVASTHVRSTFRIYKYYIMASVTNFVRNSVRFLEMRDQSYIQVMEFECETIAQNGTDCEHTHSGINAVIPPETNTWNGMDCEHTHGNDYRNPPEG